ncbi:PRTRC system protein D [Caballeronia sp. LZ035]|uniref:PRTRC system protein D n=1 Tax=Caballeronia sp. LZ035 TaxID=3038568 RepID=UPI00285AC1FA|nr:PRTRC system protein D [Caballeronia sp. LZ035]MDR5762991.1 PRTRC system protein D [Caballeronia sp. LZ035]
MKSHAAVFAVDVGYGNTKVAFRNGSDVASLIFPSLTPTYQEQTIAIESQGLLNVPKTVAIEWNGKTYEVGPGVPLSSRNGDAGGTLADNYCTTDSYAALLGGACHFANIDSVDRLVLGLPVKNFHKYAEHLRQTFTGKLNFGNTQVTVGRVMVLPQPIGALVNFTKYHEFDQENPHLIIDVGYFTTDWVVATGLTMDERRSGGHQSGASHYFQKISERIKAKLKATPNGIERIDKAVREGKKYLLAGQDIDLAPYRAESQPVIDGTVKIIHNHIGHTEDLRSIVLTGGGAALYASTIRAEFPSTRIDMMSNPSFSNVKGFFAAGEVAMMREKQRKEGVAA